MITTKLYDLNKEELYSPDILENIYTWDDTYIHRVDSTTKKILEWKNENLQDLPIKSKTVSFNSSTFIYKYIPLPEDLPDFIKEYQEQYRENQWKEDLIYIAENKLIDDFGYQWVVEWKYGDAEPILSTDIETPVELFQLPFKEYYRQAIKYTHKHGITLDQLKQKLYHTYIRKASEYYYNHDLPTPEIPLLASEYVKSPEGEKFNPLLWQIYFLWHELKTKFKLVLSHRQAGKTTLSAYISFLHLMKKERADILYVVQTDELIYQPFQYFERLLKKYIDAGIIKAVKSDGEIRNTITGNKLKFVSSFAKAGVKSFSSPIVIFDEASFIKDKIFNQAFPIWHRKPNGQFYGFSTVDWEAKKNNSMWFWNNFRKIELKSHPMQDKAFAIRITVDENETFTEEDKKALETIKDTNPAQYYADWYCMLLTEGELFNLAKLSIPKSKETILSKYQPAALIIGYDPADTSDRAGITVNIQANNMLYTVEEYALKQKGYDAQINLINTIITRYRIPNANLPVYIAMDITGVGNAVYQLAITKLPALTYKFIYTGGKEVVFSQREYKFNIPKKELVSTAQALQDKEKLKITTDVKELKEEIQNYQKVGNTYYGITGQDDLAESWLNAVYLFFKLNERQLIKPTQSQVKIYKKRNYAINRLKNYIY